MPKRVAPLTDLQVRNAKKMERPYKLFDGGGLYVEVTPNGSKLWRLKYRQPNGKENKLHFGTYPEVTLSAPASDATPPVSCSQTESIQARRETTKRGWQERFPRIRLKKLPATGIKPCLKAGNRKQRKIFYTDSNWIFFQFSVRCRSLTCGYRTCLRQLGRWRDVEP